MKKTIFVLVKLFLVGLLLKTFLSQSVVRNNEFFPRSGFTGSEWYSKEQLSPWDVDYIYQPEHPIHDFYITTWFQLRQSLPNTTCLIMFMNRTALYIQRNIQLSQGLYQFSAVIATSFNKTYRQSSSILISFHICRFTRQRRILKNRTPKIIFFQPFLIRQDTTCTLKMKQINLKEPQTQVYISKIKIQKHRPRSKSSRRPEKIIYEPKTGLLRKFCCF